ncbi:MAG: response regulator transcription factor [Bacteroidota bacterium]
MIKLLIVDDEKMTRDSLQEFIPWNELGIDIVAVAKNGIEALNIAKKLCPDIMLCDVRMPKMDGVKLAEEIRIMFPSCRIIFLSAYADKEYLKAAINLKALRYIEKPISSKEIEEVVREAVSIHLEETRKDAELKSLHESISGSIPLIRQELALELIRETRDTASVMHKYRYPSLNITLEGWLTTGVISLNWHESAPLKLKDELRDFILQGIYDIPLLPTDHFLTGFTGLEEIILIVKGKIDRQTTSSENFFEIILIKLLELFEENCMISVGVGPSVESVSKLHSSYTDAVLSLTKQFYRGSNKVFYHNDLNREYFKSEKDVLFQFETSLTNNVRDTALLIDKLTNQIKNAEYCNTEEIKELYFNLYQKILDMAIRMNIIDKSSADYDESRRKIKGLKTLDDLHAFVSLQIEGIFVKIDEREESGRKVYEIMRYIRDHYAETDLSIQTIASHVYLSQSYLCSLFKRTTGRTLNEFITETRIEKAKELLKDNRIKLLNVAYSTGFTDANYFSTVFKKQVGCSPSEYRERL